MSKTKPKNLLSTHYPALRQILQTWTKFHLIRPISEEEVLAEILWNNDSILIRKKPFLWPTWRAAGIKCIHDLLCTSNKTQILGAWGIISGIQNSLQFPSGILDSHSSTMWVKETNNHVHQVSDTFKPKHMICRWETPRHIKLFR